MELDDLPLLTRVHHRIVSVFNSRIATDLEWSADYSDQGSGLDILFFAQRSPLLIEITAFTSASLRVTSLMYEVGGSMSEVNFCVREIQEEGSKKTLLRPARILRAGKVVIAFEKPVDEVQMRVNVWVAGKRRPADLQLIDEAQDHMQHNEAEEAIDLLREYESTYSNRNPNVAYWIAVAYKTRDDFEKAEESSVRALVNGNFDACADLYQSIQRERPKRKTQELLTLQDRGHGWELGAQVGFLVLEKRQEFRLGFDGHYLKKCSEIVEVRRAAAARMLREMEFLFSAHNEALVYSSVRVLHANGEMEELSLEHFRVADSESKNLFITHEDQKAGHWILPDLAPGDVIEWEYHLLCRERRIDGHPSLFVLAALCHDYFPTLQAECKMIAPSGSPLHVTTRNTSAELLKGSETDYDTYVLAASRFLPAKRTGFAFENSYLNPLVACGTSGHTWAEIARAARRINFGESDGATAESIKLPKPLADIVEGSSEPFVALEHTFYWVRDNIKYASFLSGRKLIGESSRAEKIIAAGVGDCNDKSYLLQLVCRRLQIPSDFILVSTTAGITIEDLPADQFDHVFLRVRHNDRWAYMDAANQLSVFGSAPAWCQGFRAVVLDEAGNRDTIELDEPAVNRIEIHEVFSLREDGRLRGTFDFKAFGQNGRLFDERWKSMSLSLDDQLQAGQDCLRSILPAAIVTDFNLHSHTSMSSLFHVSGNHSRCRLVTLGGSRDEIATLSWELPMLPLQYWRTLQIDKLFVFELPMAIDITVVLEGELFQALADLSSLSSLDAGFCTVNESVTHDKSSCRIHRSVEISRRFIEESEIDRVPEALEHLEMALQLVLRFAGKLTPGADVVSEQPASDSVDA